MAARKRINYQPTNKQLNRLTVADVNGLILDAIQDGKNVRFMMIVMGEGDYSTEGYYIRQSEYDALLAKVKTVVAANSSIMRFTESCGGMAGTECSITIIGR